MRQRRHRSLQRSPGDRRRGRAAAARCGCLRPTAGRRINKLTGQTVAVIINDSHGRAWREGSTGVAIGIAGMRAIKDERGQRDLFGYQLQTSVIGLADEIASAASLLMGQTDEGIPAVVVRGLTYDRAEGTAGELIRPKERDLFR